MLSHLVAVFVICGVVKGLLLAVIVAVLTADLSLENGLQVLDSLRRMLGKYWTLPSREKLKAAWAAPIVLRCLGRMMMSLRCSALVAMHIMLRCINDWIYTTLVQKESTTVVFIILPSST